jgi:ATP-dependent DNA helicase UvrD/PcrA
MRAVPVDDLAVQLGLVVLPFHPETRRSGTLGWLEPGEDIVFLRDGIAEPIRRFTLAHELGHFVLHRQHQSERDSLEDENALALCDGADLDSPLDGLAADEVLRAGQVYSGKARRESEANSFAASLLLPSAPLLRRFAALSAAAPTTRARRLLTQRLAAEFGVSEEVLLRRLTALLARGPDDDGHDDEVPGEGSPAPRAELPLDAWQREAARSETPALIVAGPGTGKTSTLVARVAHLVRERGVPADAILALTFSNKAAGEMRERLTALLASASSTSTPLTLPAVSTIHAFCGDLLRRYGPLVGLRPDFRLIGAADGYFLLRRLADDLVLSRYQPLGAPAFHFPTLLAAISRAKDELCDAQRYADAAAAMRAAAETPEQRDAAAQAVEVAAVYTAYEAALSASGDADFGDLIRLTVQLLDERPEILTELRVHFQHVLVDEFQDINRAMGVLFHTLAGERGPLWAVGDADQAIYRFRGASPANLARFTREYPGAHIHTLRRNYRSVPAVLHAAAGVAGTVLGAGERPPLEASRSAGTAAALTLASAAVEDAELSGLADAIQRRVAAGRSLGDQVVLCRTRRQCQRVARFLQDAGISVRLTAPLLEQDDIKDVLAVVALLADRSGAGLLRAGRISDHAFSLADARAVLAAAQGPRATPPALLLSEQDTVPGLTPAGRSGLARLGKVLGELRRSPDIATGLARYFFALTGIGARLLAGVPAGDPSSPSSAAHFARLFALGRAFDEARRSQTDAATPNGRSADWAGFLEYVRVMAMLRQEAAGADEAAAEEASSLRVLTVHASKGLEFPVVYLPGLADRRFPSQRRADPAPLPPGLEDADAPATTPEQSHLAEEACLFYVALTRARDELVLSYAERYGRMRYRPSPFLAPVSRALGDQLAYARWEGVPTAPLAAEQASRHERELPVTGSELPLRPSAIETYRRCPRQFAYRYVYGLRPAEVGLATLRRSLHDTLTTLHAGFAATGRDRPSGDGESASAVPSLEEAVALFESSWMAALREESRVPAGPDADALSADVRANGPEPFSELYLRHGREVVQRAWEELARGRSGASTPEASRTQQAEATFDHTVAVRVGQREVAVTLDRVERLPHETAAAAGQRGRQAARDTTQQPVRIVRHRFGRNAAGAAPDVRTLFYSLAAEQGYAAAAEVVTHNLSTGELEAVEPHSKKLVRLREEVDALLGEMQSGVYPARPDPQTCQSCPFLLICPA